MSGNYLALEQLIIDRLKAGVPELKLVSDWSDYASLEEAKMPMPSAYVIYQGDVIQGDAGQGAAQRIEQQWAVVIAVRNVAGKTGKGIRDEAGPLMARVLELLMGWKPEAASRPMRRIDTPPPEYSNKVGYFQMFFAAPMILTGAQS